MIRQREMKVTTTIGSCCETTYRGKSRDGRLDANGGVTVVELDPNNDLTGLDAGALAVAEVFSYAATERE